MALITRCPNCAAAFRITPLDLRAQGGDVRCGRCAQIFDGYSTLATVREPETIAEPATPVGGQRTKGATEIGQANGKPEPALSTEGRGESETPSTGPDESIAEVVTAEVLPGQAATAALAAEQPAVEERVAEAAPPEEPPVKGWETAGKTGYSAVDTSGGREEPVWRAQEDVAENQEDFAEEDYSPRQHASDKPQSVASTAAWVLGSLFLFFVLAAQAVYFYRAELAVMAPAAKPYLASYCELLDCTIRLPQRAKLLNIESSEMQSDTQRPGVIMLNATVRNHASYPQAFPLFQLTLIDAKDRPLASRTFLPEAYLGHKAGPAEAIAPNDEINISLHLDSGNLNAAGYRLSLLYPGS